MSNVKYTYSIILIIILSLSGFISGQAQTTLQVYDAQTLQPLQYATVKCSSNEHSRIITTTDEYGEIDIPQSQSTTVEISYIGYQPLIKTIQPAHTKILYLYPYESEIEEVVITGLTEEQEAKDNIYDVAIISEEELEHKAANNLRDALMTEMNVRIEQDGVLGSRMSLQGLSGNNVKIMIDGVPVVGRLDGNIDLSQINLNNIERIEVVEGPMSVIYGTDALAGVINLITKSSQKNDVDGFVNTYYESIGTYNIDGLAGIKKDKHLVQINGGRYFFNGWHPTAVNRNVDWDPKEQYFGGLTYVLRTENDWFHRFKGQFYSDKILNRKNPVGVFPVAFDDWYKTKRIDAAYIANGKLSEKLHFNNTVAFNHYERISEEYYKDLTSLETSLQESSKDFINQWTARGIFSHSNLDKKLNYQFGYDINIENGKGNRFEAENGKSITLGEAAVFGAAIFTPNEKWSIQPALRYGYNSQYNVLPTPSLAIKNSFHKNWTYRFSYGMGYRTPDLKELYLEFVDKNHRIFGDEELTPELSHNLNINLTFATSKKIHYFKWKQSFFFNHKFNAIALFASAEETSSTNTLFRYTNIGEYQTLGIQSDANYRVKDFQINYGFGYIGRYNKSQYVDGKKFLFYPEMKLQAGYDIKRIGLNISTFWKWNGAYKDFTLNTENNELNQIEIESYHIMDLTATKTFWDKRIRLNAGVKNLFNVTNTQGTSNTGAHSSDNGTLISTGRSYFVGLKIGGKS